MAEISPTFAESVALEGVSLDGEREFSVRLGRFPGRGEGTLWVSAFVGRKRFGGADGPLELGIFGDVTPVDAADVTFEVSGQASARFESRERHSKAMVGHLTASAQLHDSLHPPPGRGSIPITIEADFVATHEGVRVRPGRLEVMGRVTAVVKTPSGEYSLEVPGKWHEQTGERPRFAPRFTYFAVQGEDVGLLASAGARGAWGYALLDGKTTRVTGFSIDPQGPPIRAFRVDLLDGRTLEGEAIVKRETSVPIEGQRRPGATVITNTNVGVLVGHLNDWDPK